MNEKYIETKVALDILNMINEISFSEKYLNFRINYGSNGTRDLIISKIREKYIPTDYRIMNVEKRNVNGE